MSTGSGFAISDHAFITNRHVVGGANLLQVSTFDGHDVEVTTAGAAIVADLAIVWTVQSLPATVRLAQSNPATGAAVTAVGFPLGGPLTTSHGKVLGYARDPVGWSSKPMLLNDAPIEHGSSGSALLNDDGELVGVVYAVTGAPVVAAAAPYTYDCFWKPDPTTEDVEELATTQITEAWHLKDVEVCSAEMDPSHKPTAPEKQALALYKTFNADETTKGALETLMGICADGSDFTDGSPSGWTMNVLTGAATLCPKAPHVAAIRAQASGAVFDDGTYVVGTEVKPGTYRTGLRVGDCYWERTTDGGDTIANDFVTFAPKGVTVTIRKSDGGFKSTDCGVWKRVS